MHVSLPLKVVAIFILSCFGQCFGQRLKFSSVNPILINSPQKGQLKVIKKDAGKLILESSESTSSILTYTQKYIGQLKTNKSGFSVKERKLPYKTKITPIQSEILPLGSFKVKPGSSFGIKNLNTESGLNSDKINQIIERNNGEIWGLSAGTLFRLLHGKVEEFNSRNGFPEAFFNDIIEYNNSLYISSFGNSLYKFDNGELTNYIFDDKFPCSHLLDLEVHNGELYIGTYGNGIIKLNSSGDFNSYEIPELKQELRIINSINQLGNGIVFSTKTKIFFSNSTNNLIKEMPQFLEEDVRKIITLRDSSIWVLGSNKLYRAINDSLFEIFIPDLKDISDVFKGKSGNISISFKNGIVILLNNNEYLIYGEKEGLGNSFSGKIIQDKFNRLWCPSKTQGINLITPSNFQNFETNAGGINAICKGKNNALVYENLKNGGLVINDNRTKQSFYHPELRTIQNIVYDSQKGSYWIITHEKLFEITSDYKIKSITLEFDDGRNTGNFISLTSDKNNNLLLCTYNAGFVKLAGEQASFYNSWYDFHNSTIDVFSTQVNAAEWLVCNSSGEIGLIKDDLIRIYTLYDSVSNILPYCAFVKGNDSILIGSSKALFLITNNRCIPYKINSLINNSRIKSISFEKEKNTLWLGTNKGLIKHEFHAQKSILYNSEYGLNSSTIQGDMVKLQGAFYWPTSNGIIKYIPFSFTSLKKDRELNLEKIELLDKESKRLNLRNKGIVFDSILNGVPQNLSLPYYINTLQIWFGAYNWGRENLTKIYYSINESKQWITTNKEGIVYLQNLSPGVYNINVKAVFPDAPDTYYHYSLTIRVPFYRSLWFICCLIALVIFGLYLLIRKANTFQFDKYESFNESTFLTTKVRVLAIANLFFLFGLDIIFNFFKTDSVNLTVYISALIASIIILVYTFSKAINYKILHYSFLGSYFGLSLLYISRAHFTDFPFHISVEIAITMLYLVFVFKDLKNIVLASLLYLFISAISVNVSHAPVENKYLFMYSVFVGLLGVFVYHLIENKKFNKIIFADKLLTHSNQFVLVGNENGDVVYCNQFLLDRFNLTEQEVLGDGWWIFRGLSGSEKTATKNFIKEMFAISGFNSRSYTNTINFNGENIYIKWKGTIFENKYALGIGEEITVEIKQKEELDRISKQTEIANETGKEITSCKTIEEVVRKVHSGLLKIVNISSIEVGILNTATDALVFYKSSETHVDIESSTHNLADPNLTLVQCFRLQKEFIITNQNNANNSQHYLPLIKESQCLGVLIINLPNTEPITENYKQLFRGFSNYVSIAIHNALLYLNLEHLVEERTIEITKSYNNTKLLSEISQEITSSTNIKEINRKLFGRLKELVDLHSFGTGIYNSENESLEWWDFYEGNSVFPYTSYSVREPDKLAGVCFNRKETVILNNYDIDFQKYFNKKPPIIKGVSSKSIVYLPLLSSNGVIGCMTVQSQNVNAYNEYHVDLLKSISIAVSKAIENVNFYKELETQVALRTKKIEEQKAELEKLSLVATNVLNGVVITDPENKIEWANQSFLALMEYTLEEILGERPIDKFSGPKTAQNIISDVKNNKEDSFEVIQYNKSNKEIWFLINVTPIYNHNNVLYKKVHIITDITNQKLIEQEIKQLSLVAEKTSNGITISDKDGRIIWANGSYLKMFEIPFEELVGKQPKVLFSPNDSELHQKLTVLNNTGGGYHLEINAQTFKKNPIWIELNTTIIKDSYGKTLQVEVVNNITERKLKELLIERQNEDILSSIRYAQRIQSALLPDKATISSLAIDSFMYFKPKDIIGGDFYWVHQLGTFVIVAVGDCTGHGVPGAIMTSLGINGLINSVQDMKMTDPAQILTYIDAYIQKTLATSIETGVDDGMELALVVLNTATNEALFSGASRPLIIDENGLITQIKGSMRSIGSKFIKTAFVNETFVLTENTYLYMFSDGIVDQFNPTTKKRFGSKNLLTLIKNMSTLSIKEKEAYFSENFNLHQSNSEQTDDVILFCLTLKK